MSQPVKNRTIFTGDNLPIMRGMNSAGVDLIYLDPPFNSKHNYAAPIGSKAAGAAFKDTWTLSEVDIAWTDEIKKKNPDLYSVIMAISNVGGKSDMSYLIYMAVRMMEMYRILKPTGSIYLHCDPTMSHSLKLMMDSIFGKNNFRNEIIWKRDVAGKGAKRKSSQFPRNSDTIFYYAPQGAIYNQPFAELDEQQQKAYRYQDEAGRKYKAVQLGDYTQKSISNFKKQGLIHTSSSGKQYKKYFLDEAKATIGNIWVDIPGFGTRTAAKERTGYPTQKPLALLTRIIKVSSSEGDIIFDPFCGCATTLIAAEKEQRQWIGIDISDKAVDLVKQRLYEEVQIGALLGKLIPREDIPKRTDLGKLPPIKTHKKALFGEQRGTCNGCRKNREFAEFEIDHIIPKAKGGTDHIDNLQLLCTPCNRMKGSRTWENFLVEIKAMRIGYYAR